MRRLALTFAILSLLTLACGGGGDGGAATTVLDAEPIAAIDPCDLLDEDTASELVGDDVEKVDADVEEGGLGCAYNVGSELGASMALERGTADDLPGADVGRAMGNLGEGDDGGTLVEDDEKVEVVYIVREVIVTIVVQPVDGVDQDAIDAVVTFAEDTEDEIITAVTGEEPADEETTTTSDTDAPTTTAFEDEEVPEGEPLEIDGDAATATVDRAGGIFRFNFEAEAGTVIFVELSAVNTAGDGQCIDVTVVDTNDISSLSGRCVGPGADDFIDRLVLPNTGTYGLVIDPRERDTGSVTAQITSATDDTGTMEIDGDAVTGTIEQKGGIAKFTFEADAGDVIFVDIPSAVTDGSDDDQCVDVTILDTNELSSLGGRCVDAAGGFIDRTELTTGGTYSIVIDPRGRDTATVEVQITSTT